MWCNGYDIDLGPHLSWSLTGHGNLDTSLNLLGLSFHIICKKRVIRIPQQACMRNKTGVEVKHEAVYWPGSSQ